MGVRVRLPLRVLLPCLAVGLVGLGAVAIGLAGQSAANGYLVRHADGSLRACTGMLGHRPVVQPGSGPALPGGCEVELLSADGRVLAPVAGGGPVIPAGRWLAAHLAQPVTVAGDSGRWRVVIDAVRYQPQHIMYVYGADDVRYALGGRAGHGSRGLLVVMAGLASTGRAALGYGAVAGVVLVALAIAAAALTRTLLPSGPHRPQSPD